MLRVKATRKVFSYYFVNKVNLIELYRRHKLYIWSHRL